ncbi:MAG: glycosyltransferase [Chloroflexota bacterium]|nr:glycosyltransferase [Chloroflexota bacterium]
MKVVMLSKACLVGAYQRKLEELARQPNVELTVLVPPSWRDERGITRLERAHTKGYELRVIPILLNGYFHLHFYPTLAHNLRQLRPHILHIDEEPYNLATFLALHAARRVGAKSLFFTWQNLARRYPLPFRWMERFVLTRADYALAGSTEAVKVLRAKGYQGPVRVVPQFGVDPEIFQFSLSHLRAQGDNLQPFTIGYVGRLVEEKGVDLLLRAAAGLRGEWELRIVGDGPERERLKTLARELGIASQVAFEGGIPSAQMPDFYPQLDALVLPSRTRPNWKEQFGRVLIEAMACGVPVVGSDSGEIPHVIGEAGQVFPEEDVAALRSILARLQVEEALRKELAHRGRARVLAHYTQTQVASATYEVYLEMRG